MGERASNEMEKLSLRTKNRFPSDLLQRFTVFTAGEGPPARSDLEDDLGSGSGEEVELNLGLSLGGRFGVDKSSNKLLRSSSIANILPVVRDDNILGSGHENLHPGSGQIYSGLVRTSSLPVETEDEWRKRKELQSLRRLAAKRRRWDKQRNLAGGEAAAVGSSTGPSCRSNKWPPGGGTCKGGIGWLSSQGSTPQFEWKHRPGHEASSISQESYSCSNTSSVGEVEPESSRAGKEIGGGGGCSPEDMPCVFTQGDGPNGRLVEGILYKYGKGEQVKIMCICHGSFLSPAEFVKHAGGTDFLHPLKHIVVKPSSSFS